MDAAQRNEILSRYREHSQRFATVAARRGAGAEVIPFTAPLQELEQEPTAREIEVLQLISDGLVNREIGTQLFLSPVAPASRIACRTLDCAVGLEVRGSNVTSRRGRL